MSDASPHGDAQRGNARRLKIAALGSAGALLVGAGSAAGYLGWTNKDRADGWEARAGQLEGTVESLNEIVAERSEALNERTRELNTMASRLRDAERALIRSESDVLGLERRQRRLANEKAQVEDARAQLELERDALAEEAEALGSVAVSLFTCRNGLTELLNHVIAGDSSAAAAIVDRVNADCAAADDEVSSYLATYGD